jgi:hypothetical protein
MLCSFKQVLALSELHCSMNERSGMKCLDQRLLKNMKIAEQKETTLDTAQGKRNSEIYPRGL